VQVQQTQPHFTAEQWTGTSASQTAVAELVEYIRRGFEITWSVDQEDGTLIGTQNWGQPIRIPFNHHVVMGPAWGGDSWEAPEGGGTPDWEICSPALFANKYTA
jgi:hypothetical protein